MKDQTGLNSIKNPYERRVRRISQVVIILRVAHAEVMDGLTAELKYCQGLLGHTIRIRLSMLLVERLESE